MKNNYYIQKDKINGQTIIIEFDKLNGYNILPKTKREDEIAVNKIVFVNPSFSEKIIKRKINLKLNHLLKLLESINDGDDEDEQKPLLDKD